MGDCASASLRLRGLITAFSTPPPATRTREIESGNHTRVLTIPLANKRETASASFSEISTPAHFAAAALGARASARLSRRLRATKSSIGSFSEPRTMAKAARGSASPTNRPSGVKADALTIVDEQRREQRAARCVPELDRIIVTCRRDAGAIRRERY